MTHRATMEEVMREIQDCLALARSLFNFDFHVNIHIHKMGRRGGEARWDREEGYTLRLNEQLLQSQYDEERKNTIAHEIAHLVCYAFPALGENHNAGWKRVCIALGGDGKRTHSMPLQKVRRTRRAIYHVGQHEVKLGLTHHKRLQTGQYPYLINRREGYHIKPEHFSGKIVMA